jgi:hypothetical protein
VRAAIREHGTRRTPDRGDATRELGGRERRRERTFAHDILGREHRDVTAAREHARELDGIQHRNRDAGRTLERVEQRIARRQIE